MHWFYKTFLPRVGLICEDGRFLEVNTVIFNIAVLGNSAGLSTSAALMIEFADVVFVVTDSFGVSCFADVGDGAIRAGNLVEDVLRSFFRSMICWQAKLKEASQLVHAEAGSFAQVVFSLEGVSRRDHQANRHACEKWYNVKP